MVVTLRQNTFKIDLRNFEKRPSFEDVHDFIFRSLALRPTQVQRLQMNHVQCCVHVKCNDLETALKVVEQHNDRHELEVAGKRYKVRLSMDDDRIEIKVHDLSENVSNADIATFFQQYGQVHTVNEAVWGKHFAGRGIPSGVRIVQMVLKNHLKSYVTIKGEQTYISYLSQPATCRHCTQLVHTGKSCTANKKSLAQAASNKITSTNLANPTVSITPSVVTSKVVKKKGTDELQNLQQRLPQQQSKRVVSRVDDRSPPPSNERSPPRKKKDNKAEPAVKSVVQNENENSTDDDDMDTTEIPEEPDFDEDADKWFAWMQKYYKRVKNKSRIEL